MASQHWLRWWLGAVRQQAITGTNVEPSSTTPYGVIRLQCDTLLWWNGVEMTRNKCQAPVVLIQLYSNEWSLKPIHDDVIKWKHSPRYWPFDMASDSELWCCLWPAPECTDEYTMVRLVIWDAIAPIMPSLYCECILSKGMGRSNVSILHKVILYYIWYIIKSYQISFS